MEEFIEITREEVSSVILTIFLLIYESLWLFEIHNFYYVSCFVYGHTRKSCSPNNLLKKVTRH